MSSRITIEDVAALARVSIKTVSRVLNDEPNVQISTRQRVTEAINRLNFRPSRVARSLAARRTFILGLMYDNPCAHYVAKLQAGALRACASEGYDLLVLPRSYRNTDTAAEIASLYRQSRFDGVILSPPLSDVTSLIQGLRQERVPLTLISPGGALVESSSVHTNDQEAARLMTEYLISMGHRDIAFVAGHPDHVAVCTRTAGFLEAMQAAGISVPDDFVYAGLNSFESGEQAGAALLAKPKRPTAIFAANDEMAAGVCVAARHRGLDIPRDLSVCGFDDIPIAIQVWPALTSVTQPIQDMAEKAAELLIRQIKEPESAVEHVEIRSELMVRESTHRVPEADA